MPAISALLIDFDGVLRHWPPDDDAIERESGVPIGAIRIAAFAPARLRPAILGRIDDAAWREAIAADLAARFPEADATRAVHRWSQPPGRIDEDVRTILQAARTHVRIVLVTNATSRLPTDLAVLGLSNLFHGVANSSELGAAKPDAAIFHAALALADAAPHEALFVDDSPHNVAAAVALGIPSRVFEGPATLRAFLASHNVPGFDLGAAT